MTIERRIIDATAVERAEYARADDMFSSAVVIASHALGLPENPWYYDDVRAVANFSPEAVKLACLTNILVDASKSEMNRLWWPPEVLELAEQAVTVLELVYGNEVFLGKIKMLTQDHKGRPNNFWPESRRGLAKLRVASSVLYGKSQTNLLLEANETVLEYARTLIVEEDPLKQLITIEILLSKAARGVPVEPKNLGSEFKRLVIAEVESNPDRVATVASWLILWGEKFGDAILKDYAQEIYDTLIAMYPRLDFMVEKEKKKIVWSKVRAFLMRKITPITTSPQRREALLVNLLQQRDYHTVD